MADVIARVKPDPIPVIQAVPEYLADADLKTVYDDTKSVLQVPWMGVVTMAFAHYPNFYAALWRGYRDLATSAEFVEACRDLRRCCEDAVGSLAPSSLSGDLAEQGYAAGELDEIRALIEVFSHGNMPYLMIATAARLLLEGHALSDETMTSPFHDRHGPSKAGRLTLIEPHHADAPTVGVYDDIKATLGLPFVNTDYRALARWPTYFSGAWRDLRRTIAGPDYERVVVSVHDFAAARMLRLPNPGRLSPDGLRSAANRDGSLDEIRNVVRLFHWLLPGLVTNVAYFRAQLSQATAS